MNNILVTGCNGQLGSEFKNLASKYSQFKFFFKDISELDLLDSNQLERYFRSTSIEVVVNCAAYTAVDQAEAEPENAQALNVTALDSLCKLSRAKGFKLIHFSTDYVFGGTAHSPYSEDDPLCPLGVYGKTKARGESVMQTSGIDGWIIRTSWLFSPYGKNFVKTIFSLLQNKDEINVVSDQRGRPTYAIDLAAATLKALDQKPTFDGVKVYHYTNSGHTTWYGLALAIQAQINTHCKIHAVDTATYPTKAKRPKYSVLSCEKIKKDFNLNPQAWESSLKDCLKKIG